MIPKVFDFEVPIKYFGFYYDLVINELDGSFTNISVKENKVRFSFTCQEVDLLAHLVRRNENLKK